MTLGIVLLGSGMLDLLLLVNLVTIRWSVDCVKTKPACLTLKIEASRLFSFYQEP
jgi:hypothetical protein